MESDSTKNPARSRGAQALRHGPWSGRGNRGERRLGSCGDLRGTGLVEMLEAKVLLILAAALSQGEELRGDASLLGGILPGVAGPVGPCPG